MGQDSIRKAGENPWNQDSIRRAGSDSWNQDSIRRAGSDPWNQDSMREAGADPWNQDSMREAGADPWNHETMLGMAPYSLDKNEKKKMLAGRVWELTLRHAAACGEYRNMLDGIGFDPELPHSYEEYPFLPVRIFKELDLKSVADGEIVKTITSSGTSGQKVSKIHLDRATSSNQQKAMAKIVSDFTGQARMPMIIIDSASVLKDRKQFSARGAGILGFSVFGSKKFYALDADMKLDVDGLSAFLEECRGKRILLFGFTFMIWQHFYQELLRLRECGIRFDLSNGILIHGGGWKKLQNEAVSKEEFHQRLKDACGISDIHDYYGMAEQTGSIYMECECGHLHTSIFSDVIARRPEDFSICDFGEKGILQVISTIPESYPGHSLLTEDWGTVLGEDDCPCGRKGKYFQVEGRIAKAELRGCSDTYASDYQGQADNRRASSSCFGGTYASGSQEQADNRRAGSSRFGGAYVSGSQDGNQGVHKEGAASHLLEKVNFLSGNQENILMAPGLRPLMPFDESILDFLQDLSKEFMSDKACRQYSDIVSLGFWLRRQSLISMKQRFARDGMLGLGVAFHIAPSNVPVNYAYSLFVGLLCGNANIVRVPSKDFAQVPLINAAINRVLEEGKYQFLRPYVTLVRYEKNRELNDYFSSICDARVIWGGDATIQELRKSPLPARAREITFADRYSLAVIDSEAYLAADHKHKAQIAMDFYNDTYLSDQNACTSPRAVVWVGQDAEEAKEIFWDGLLEIVKEKYRYQAIQGVDKMAQFYATVAGHPGLSLEPCKDNVLYRIRTDQLGPELMEYRGNSGYFYEYSCQDIMAIREFCNDTRCQTIGFYGDRALFEPLIHSGIKGVDRIVPIGHTMDFDFLWDGYQLAEHLTRRISMISRKI